MMCLGSCYSSKHITKKETSKKVVREKIFCRFYISFYSIGSGIDGKGKTELVNFINEFGARHHTAIQYNVLPWGKEGETDFCFTLSNLNKKQRKHFIADCKILLSSHKHLRFGENEYRKMRR